MTGNASPDPHLPRRSYLAVGAGVGRARLPRRNGPPGSLLGRPIAANDRLLGGASHHEVNRDQHADGVGLTIVRVLRPGRLEPRLSKGGEKWNV